MVMTMILFGMEHSYDIFIFIFAQHLPQGWYMTPC